ncbi:MAG: hydrogenase maturation nickel metallochaperone HypA [Planctomycetes bacterium]|nr:hydrogenase maturation nickel metallochaperone HypA [Planctomycetota bacterium]
MHELSIAMSLIDVASEEAERRQVRVAALHLKVGPLSGVVQEALVSAYELAREGTDLAEARLEIQQTPIRMNCPTCRSEQAVASIQELWCAECGAPAIELTSGRELELIALEIE